MTDTKQRLGDAQFSLYCYVGQATITMRRKHSARLRRAAVLHPAELVGAVVPRRA
jgi:hypothetical protein